MKNNVNHLLLFFLCIGVYTNSNAQTLLETLDNEYPKSTQYELATFKTTRLAIGQSVENRKQGVLQLMTMHRFWNLPNSNIQSFIADRWNARFGLEYGISDRLTIGGGWSSFEKISDTYLKYRLIRQIKNKNNSVSVTLFQNASFTEKGSTLNKSGSLDNLNKRLAYTSQVLIAHKFNTNFSAQISPTFVHKLTPNNANPNNTFALGIGGRYKVKPHVSFVSEYYYVANPLKSVDTYGAFALGVNWDVRFLILQFQMTNSFSMVEDRFITQTQKNFNFKDGNLFFGFNAIFTIHTQKK
ncbi:DUF5777 family beta-barrel protein [Wenyingzhuangia sp. IMCC45533]